MPVAYGWEGRASRAAGALKKEEKGVGGWTRTVTEMKNKMLHMMHLARRAVHAYVPPLIRYVWPREKKLPGGRRPADFYELSPPFDLCIVVQVQSKRPLG